METAAVKEPRKVVGFSKVLVCIGLYLLTVAQAKAQSQGSMAQNFGFKGPVHTVATTSKELGSIAKADPSFVQPVGPGWSEFDDHGNLLAQAVDASLSDQVPRSIYSYDVQGRMTMRGDWSADGVTMIRQEYTYGPFGVVEARWYSGKTFTGRTAVEYDAHGNFIRDASYDADGNLQHESLRSQDVRTNSVEEQGVDADGTSTVHVIDRVEEKTGILEHQSIDPKGHVVGVLQLRDGEFLSWWQSPDFQCDAGQNEIGIFNWNEEARRFQIYFNLRCPRTLEITKLHHSGKHGNIENDREERYLEDGTLLARADYEYVRDAHENWTQRTVLVWDPTQKEMITVRQDERTITYYDEPKSGPKLK